MSQALTSHRPTWAAIPEDLERAWLWMEEHGFGMDTPAGYVLAPYSGEWQLGAVFIPDLTLEGWFDPDTPAHDRLLPIAEVAGDGSHAALWLDDKGQTRVVFLGSEGDGYVLADNVRDFLILLAIGYDELTSYTLGDLPDNAEAIEAVAKFRAWVEKTFGVKVPQEWPVVGDDFSAWLGVHLAHS